MITTIKKLVRQIFRIMIENGLKIATVESCTGGYLASSLTDISGSSRYFESGFVLYTNESKSRNFNINKSKIARFGAVSKEITRELHNILKVRERCDISIAITGYLAPYSGIKNVPIGTVYLAISFKKILVEKTMRVPFNDRLKSKQFVTIETLNILLELLEKQSKLEER